MNTEATSQQMQWRGNFSLFLAATGAAVGLGNIWKFPYVAGEHGGGAFVLVYLFFVFIIGVPLFMSELMLGRRGQQSPAFSFQNIVVQLKLGKYWRIVGLVATLSGFLILSYYSVVAGEVLAYALRTVAGTFDGQSADGVASLYDRFRANPEALLAWHSIFMVLTCIVVARGVRQGLEKTISLMMVLLVLILLLLVFNAVHTDAFAHAASFLFNPDYDKLLYVRDASGAYVFDADGNYQLTFKGILTAMGHAFFTLGLAVGTMMIFGAYMKPQCSIPHVTVAVVLADTGIALLAGLAIFPIVLSYGLSAGQGPGLVFTTLPIAFGAMDYGKLLGGLFYLLLFIAALTSAVALLEPSVAWLIDKTRMSRVKAATSAGIACWLLGLFSVYSVAGATLGDLVLAVAEWWSDALPSLSHKLFDLSVFQMIDSLVTLVLLPLTGLLIAVFSGWIIPPEQSLEDLKPRHKVTYSFWRVLVRYITPVLILVIFFFGLKDWVSSYVLPRPVL